MTVESCGYEKEFQMCMTYTTSNIILSKLIDDLYVTDGLVQRVGTNKRKKK